jgi:hypothetical protein
METRRLVALSSGGVDTKPFEIDELVEAITDAASPIYSRGLAASALAACLADRAALPGILQDLALMDGLIDIIGQTKGGDRGLRCADQPLGQAVGTAARVPAARIAITFRSSPSVWLFSRSDGDVFKIRSNCCVLLSIVMGSVSGDGPKGAQEGHGGVIPMAALPEAVKPAGALDAQGKKHWLRVC